MNKELKCRAWDNELKCFIYFNSYENISFWKSVVKYKMPVTQFTGLQDKNGKDIYGDDIVKFIAIIDETKHHKDECIGVIDWDNEDAGFYILNNNDKYPHVKLWFAENIEIIGNKYDTPELITN